MLTVPKVINYVKRRLGFPHVIIELSDLEIEEQMLFNSLVEFSKYLPDTAEITLKTTDKRVRTSQENVFLIHDPDECDIIGVSDVVFPQHSMFMQGYPFYSPITTIDQVPEQLIQILNAENAENFSKTKLVFDFMLPNKLRVYHAMIPDAFVVRYQRVHPETLNTIPVDHQLTFQNLVLADIMLICGNIRNKYSTISTPFGDVPLGTELGAAGEALKDKIIQHLEALPPNVIFHIG